METVTTPTQDELEARFDEEIAKRYEEYGRDHEDLNIVFRRDLEDLRRQHYHTLLAYGFKPRTTPQDE